MSAGRIQRADLDGGNVEDLLTELINPRDIALDLAQGKMYWTGGTLIRRADLDGSAVEDVLGGLDEPAGIVLAPGSAEDPVPAASPLGIALCTLVLLVAGGLVFGRRQAV